MTLTDLAASVKIPDHVLRDDPWCTPRWIVTYAYYPTHEKFNPLATVRHYQRESFGLIPLGSNYFIRGEDKDGRGDIELWHEDEEPFFAYVEASEVDEFRTQQRQFIETQYLSRGQLIAHIANKTSLLPCALIIPHPTSIIFMERSLVHGDFQRHW